MKLPRNGAAKETQRTEDDIQGGLSVRAAEFEAIEAGGCAPPVIVPKPLKPGGITWINSPPNGYTRSGNAVVPGPPSIEETAAQTAQESLQRWRHQKWQYKL